MKKREIILAFSYNFDSPREGSFHCRRRAVKLDRAMRKGTKRRESNGRDINRWRRRSHIAAIKLPTVSRGAYTRRVIFAEERCKSDALGRRKEDPRSHLVIGRIALISRQMQLRVYRPAQLRQETRCALSRALVPLSSPSPSLSLSLVDLVRFASPRIGEARGRPRVIDGDLMRIMNGDRGTRRGTRIERV